MSQFLNSVIRQLGRDTGKVISNSIFKDAHSTPIRMVRAQSTQSVQQSSNRKVSRSEFEKALVFDRSATPKTLIRKIQALSIILEEEMKSFLSDDYLSASEANEAFKMLNEFSSKAESVAKQLEIDETNNANELSQLEKIVTQTNNDFHELLKKASKSCEEMSLKLQDYAAEKSRFNFFRWLLLNTFYMRGFARTGNKKILNTVLANLLLIGTQPIMLIIGLITAPFEINRLKKDAKKYIEAAENEKLRAAAYADLNN